MVKAYSFREKLLWSQGQSAGQRIADVLLHAIPGAWRVRQASAHDDRAGVDYWVDHARGRPLAVDVKVRDVDYLAKRGEDDLALETWSVVEERIVGWTRDEQKGCDYILWFWQDTGRWCLVSFPQLCRVFQRHWQRWTRMYPVFRQKTPERNYHSECVFVPRQVVWRAIYEEFGGNPVSSLQK